jgi:hypothetical protein
MTEKREEKREDGTDKRRKQQRREEKRGEQSPLLPQSSSLSGVLAPLAAALG